MAINPTLPGIPREPGPYPPSPIRAQFDPPRTPRRYDEPAYKRPAPPSAAARRAREWRSMDGRLDLVV
jgi:hypothetical protein